ncbi:MAG: hypothetical protein NT131_04805 [Methanomassiliicoccales archaeon]|nr:hypothetical protein [Methanomassiliicoccales archaeon]
MSHPLVQFTNSPENEGPGEVRFIMETQATKIFGDIRLDLLSGKWPTSMHTNPISQSTIELGFRRGTFLNIFPSKDFDTISSSIGSDIKNPLVPGNIFDDTVHSIGQI